MIHTTSRMREYLIANAKLCTIWMGGAENAVSCTVTRQWEQVVKTSDCGTAACEQMSKSAYGILLSHQRNLFWFLIANPHFYIRQLVSGLQQSNEQ